MGNRKIDNEIKVLTEEFNRRIDFSNMVLSEYNTSASKQTGMLLLIQMKDHLSENILPAFVRAKYSSSNEDKMFFCNFLCISMFSFIELYSQSLNVFYDLKLLPVHKCPMNNPLLSTRAGIVEQIIDGVENKTGKTVTVENVIKRIEDSYKANEYYSEIKKILDSEDVLRLRELRNYQMHYQSIFSRYRQSYSFSDNESSFTMDVYSKDKPFQEKEYDIFMTLAEVIIDKEMELVGHFIQMFTDKKMIRLGTEEQEVEVIECLDCGKRFIFPQEIIDIYKKVNFLVPHENCKGRFDYKVLTKKYVHPELYNAIFFEGVNLLEKGSEEKSI